MKTDDLINAIYKVRNEIDDSVDVDFYQYSECVYNNTRLIYTVTFESEFFEPVEYKFTYHYRLVWDTYNSIIYDMNKGDTVEIYDDLTMNHSVIIDHFKIFFNNISALNKKHCTNS